MATARNWHDWEQAVFGDPYLIWHDGPEFRHLLDVVHREPEETARMLAVGLATAAPLAAQSIEFLAKEGLAPDGAVELLRTAATTATDTFLIRVAQALYELTRDQTWATALLPVLAGAGHWGVRLDAAIALADFLPTASLVAALGTAIAQDEEYLVRYHAANTLLRYAGRTEDIADLDDIFGLITGPKDSESAAAERARRQEAADRLTEGVHD